MALEGTLRDFHLSDIFQLIGIQKKTGVLSLKDGGEIVTVSFKDGHVVSADSSRRNIENRLGQVLVKSGRITEVNLARALTIQKETLQRLGHVLVDRGFIGEVDLKDALRIQVSQLVFRLFLWKDGDYHFNQDDTIEYDREHFTPLSAESILLEGVRMFDEWPIIEQRITSLDLVFRKQKTDEPVIIADDEDAEDIAAELDRALSGGDGDAKPSEDGIRVTTQQAGILQLVDGRSTVQEIIDRGRLSDFETCRILYDLACRDLIATTERAGARRKQHQRRRFSVAPLAESTGYLLLVGALSVSIVTMTRSPLSGSPRLIATASTVDGIMDLVAKSRVQRLSEAVRVYYLQKGFFPDDLVDLVGGKLVAENTLHDPWGRRFGYISSETGFRIIAYDAGGVENLERSAAIGEVTEGPVKRGNPTAEPPRASSPPPR